MSFSLWRVCVDATGNEKRDDSIIAATDLMERRDVTHQNLRLSGGRMLAITST